MSDWAGLLEVAEANTQMGRRMYRPSKIRISRPMNEKKNLAPLPQWGEGHPLPIPPLLHTLARACDTSMLALPKPKFWIIPANGIYTVAADIDWCSTVQALVHQE